MGATSRGLWSTALSVTATLIVCVALWWLLALLTDAPYVPTPLAVGLAFAQSLRGDLLMHLHASLLRVVAALALSLVAGIPAGLALGRVPRLNAALAPFIYLTFPVPKIVFLPILLMALGLGDAPKVALIFLTLVYQITVTTRDAAGSLPASALSSIESLGATRFQTFRHVTLPYCMPSVLTGLRISIGTAVAILFFAESFATSEGLGYMIMDAWGRADYASMYAGMAAMSLLGLGLYLLVDVAQKLICPWLKWQ